VKRNKISNILSSLLPTKMPKVDYPLALSVLRIINLNIDRLVSLFFFHQINGQINSVVDERFHIAIEEAKSYDRLIQSGEYGAEQLQTRLPLLGVPFTIKDSFAVKGIYKTMSKVVSTASNAQFES